MPPRKTTSTEVVDESTQEATDAVEPTVPPIDIPTQEPQSGTSVYSAFISAQSEIGNVAKNADNNFFKDAKGKPSKFVDLAQLNAAVLPVLTKHGLGFQQRLEFAMDRAFVVSQVFHNSGQSLPESWYPVITKDQNDPQKFGAGVTYARRYAMMAYFSIAAEDDDGNTAAKPSEKSARDQLKDVLKNMKADGAKFKELATTAKVDAEKFADLSEEDAKKVLKVATSDVPF